MSITPEAARAQAEAALDGYENAARVEEWADPLARAVTALLSAFPEPITTDDEDIEGAIRKGLRFGLSWNPDEARSLAAALAPHALARFRRPSPPTAEQVEAARDVLRDHTGGYVSLATASAALEAAARVGGAA
jgi:hypothetical protein